MGKKNAEFSGIRGYEKARDEKEISSVNLGLDQRAQSAFLERESLVSLAAKLEGGLSTAVSTASLRKRREGPIGTAWQAVMNLLPNAGAKRSTARQIVPYLSAALFTAALSGGVSYYFMASYGKQHNGIAGIAPQAGRPRTNSAPPINRARARTAETDTRLAPAPRPPLVASSNVSAPSAYLKPMTDRYGTISSDNPDSEKKPAQQTGTTSAIPGPLPQPGNAATRDQRPEGRLASLNPSPNVAGAANPEPSDQVTTRLAPDEEARMLKRASDLLDQNDIASATLIYKYLAEHGSTAGESLYKRMEALQNGRAPPR